MGNIDNVDRARLFAWRANRDRVISLCRIMNEFFDVLWLSPRHLRDLVIMELYSNAVRIRTLRVDTAYTG